jgi:CotH kinase protein
MRRGEKIIIFIALLNIVAALSLCANKLEPGYLLTFISQDTSDDNPFESSILKNPFKKNQINHLELRFKQDAIDRLSAKRQDAIKKSFLFSVPSDYVEADLKYNDINFRVTARLKGDLVDHLLGNKWSFRVKVAGNNTIEGMKTFSLHHPKLRSDIMEWIYHKMMADEGVIALRYDFVTVSVNGKYLGIYAMEEHFDKRLIEHNQRREGPIIKFDETAFWHDWFRFESTGKKSEDVQLFKTASIVPFKKYSTPQDELQYKYYLVAKKLLESLRSGRLKTSQVFDMDLMASYFAISEVLGAGHGKRWHNVRYYYNPVTSLLEPIAFDGCPGANIDVWNKNKGIFYTFHYDVLNQLIYSDPEFFSLFTKKIRVISSRNYSELFFDKYDPGIIRRINILKKEFPNVRYTKQNNVFSNQVYVNSTFDNYKDVSCYHTFLSTKTVQVVCENEGRFPVDIATITVNGNLARPQQLMRLGTKDHKYQNLAKTSVALTHDVLPDATNIVVSYSVLGASKQSSTTSVENKTKFSRLSKRLSNHKIAQVTLRDDSVIDENANVWDFDCLTVDEDTKVIEFVEEVCHIRSELIIPSGYKVECNAGKKIYLYNKASIISYSPFYFVGTKKQPILISSGDGAGNGLAIIKAPHVSTFEHVIFDNLSNPTKAYWTLTGAVTLYESDCSFDGCLFSNSRSEDALNTIRNNFTIRNTKFSKTRWDSFDSDFCKGTIRNTHFSQCGNDCIDVSGTQLTLNYVSIKSCGDKGVSAGENSNIKASKMKIQNCMVGMAGKDLSQIVARNINITSTNIGLCSYQKKPEFGPSRITAKTTTIEGSDLPWLIEKDSEIFLNGTRLQYIGKSKQKQIFKRLKNGQKLY